MELYHVGIWLITVACSWWIYHVGAVRHKKHRGPPRVPYYLPFGLDNMWELTQYSRRHISYKLVEKNILRTKSTTYEVQLPGMKTYITVDPANVKAILATQFQDFGKGPLFYESWKEFLGNGIFCVDGARWSECRALLRPQFLKQRISDLQTFDTHTRKMISLIPQDGETIDITGLFYRFTLDASTDYLFGESVKSLDNPKTAFATAFSDIQANQMMRYRLGPLWWAYYNPSWSPSLDILNKFVQPFVERALSLDPRQEKSGNLTEELSQFTRNPKDLRDQLVNILLAGRDTTAATLSFLFYELAYRPDIYARLRREVLQTLHTDGELTYSNLKGMKYLQNCLNETLRLYPIVPLNGRTALVDTTLPHGGGKDGQEPIFVPKNTLCLYSSLVMQRREDLFGPTVNDFDPSRWERWSPVPWTYIPFNGGPRICLGQNFALTEIAYVVARVCEVFERMEERSGKERGSRGYCEDIILSPLEGVKVGFIRV